MFSKKKKFVLLSVMVALLIATGVLNLFLNKNVVDTGTGVQTSAQFFAAQRQDRTLAREQELLYLKSIINDEASTPEAKKQATEKRDKLLETIEVELNCEGLIRNKGYKDCFITTGNSLFNVIIDSANLTQDDIIKITDIIVGQNAAEIDNIVISAARYGN